MGSIQLRNDEDETIHGADQFQQGFEYLHEPIGDFGVWNGQFEVAEQRSGDLRPEGWEVNADAAGSLIRDSVGACGRWCMRGGRAGVGTGGNIVSLRYIPVYEVSQGGRDYYIACAFSSDNGVGAARLGVHCYNALKVFLFTVWAVTIPNVPPGWVWHQRKIGPNGDVQLPVATRYIRVVIDLQYDSGVADFVYVDDVQFQQMKMAYSPGIRLIGGRISAAGAGQSVKSALPIFTLIAGTAITITLEEPGYIWCWYRVMARTNAVQRGWHFNVAIFLDGAQLGQPSQFGSNNPSIDFEVPIHDRTTPLTAGPHTVDLRAGVFNAGDTVQFWYLVGTAFYTRQY